MNPDDDRWVGLLGGYRVVYDPRPALKRLASGSDQVEVWNELWNELHHQGDVGEASYAAIPELVRIARDGQPLGWSLYALAATIEIERHRRANPALPSWLADEYAEAWRDLSKLALAQLKKPVDRDTLQSALAVCAIAGGNLKLGALICYLDSSELDEILNEQYAWGELYLPDPVG